VVLLAKQKLSLKTTRTVTKRREYTTRARIFGAFLDVHSQREENVLRNVKKSSPKYVENDSQIIFAQTLEESLKRDGTSTSARTQR